MIHQYIERKSGEIRTEKLYRDGMIRAIFNDRREKTGILYRAVTSAYASEILGILNYDLPAGIFARRALAEMISMGTDLSECLDDPEGLDTMRKIFERKIRYPWCRPMEEGHGVISSPADSRMLAGSLSGNSLLFIKEKFFSLDDLLGGRTRWTGLFREGDYAVFRLTPEKYHWSHCPVSGTVTDFYEIGGIYNSCNPAAVVSVENAFSRNRRAVTVINTDVKGGTGCGSVAMIEVAALMIGGIKQSYCGELYDGAAGMEPGIFLRRGQPKSHYSPGSSVDILIFEKDRISFSPDIIKNLKNPAARSRFSEFFGHPLVETEVAVRSTIGIKI
jgi:phosphatidylserine decarboxylase